LLLVPLWGFIREGERVFRAYSALSFLSFFLETLSSPDDFISTTADRPFSQHSRLRPLLRTTPAEIIEHEDADLVRAPPDFHAGLFAADEWFQT